MSWVNPACLAMYRPKLFQSQPFFFGYALALAPLVVAYTPQGSPRGLSIERTLPVPGLCFAFRTVLWIHFNHSKVILSCAWFPFWVMTGCALNIYPVIFTAIRIKPAFMWMCTYMKILWCSCVRIHLTTFICNCVHVCIITTVEN